MSAALAMAGAIGPGPWSQTFTTPGAAEFIAPLFSVRIRVRMWAPGGAGGTAGANGTIPGAAAQTTIAGLVGQTSTITALPGGRGEDAIGASSPGAGGTGGSTAGLPASGVSGLSVEAGEAGQAGAAASPAYGGAAGGSSKGGGARSTSTGNTPGGGGRGLSGGSGGGGGEFVEFYLDRVACPAGTVLTLQVGDAPTSATAEGANGAIYFDGS